MTANPWAVAIDSIIDAWRQSYSIDRTAREVEQMLDTLLDHVGLFLSTPIQEPDGPTVDEALTLVRKYIEGWPYDPAEGELRPWIGGEFPGGEVGGEE